MGFCGLGDFGDVGDFGDFSDFGGGGRGTGYCESKKWDATTVFEIQILFVRFFQSIPLQTHPTEWVVVLLLRYCSVGTHRTV